jgi:hypothetical protein
MKKILIAIALFIQVSAVMADEIYDVNIDYYDDYDYYTMHISGETNTPLVVFLDTDNNEETGYTNGEIRGADYLLEIYDYDTKNNIIFSYNGAGASNWSWTEEGSLSEYAIFSYDGINIDFNRGQFELQDQFKYRVISWDSSWNAVTASYPNNGMQEYGSNNNVELSADIITKQFTNLFERENKNDFGYDTAVYLDDAGERGLTVGTIFTTGSSKNDFYESDAFQVIKRYVNNTDNPDDDFKQISNHNYNDSFNSMLDTIEEKWVQLGSDDQSFKNAQDYIFTATTYKPAVVMSNKLKGSPLTVLNLQNAYVLHGPGVDTESTDGMVSVASYYDEYYEFESTEDEKEWLKRFIKARGKEFCSDDEHRKALSILSTLEDIVDEYNKYYKLENNFMDRVEYLRNYYEDVYSDNNKIQTKCDSYKE